MSEPLSEEEEALARRRHVGHGDCEQARLFATLDQARERIAVLEDEASYLADKVEAELGGEA